MNNLFLIGLILILILVGFGYLMADNQRLREQNDLLKSENQSTRDENGQLRSEVQSVSENSESLLAETKRLREIIESLLVESQRLKQELVNKEADRQDAQDKHLACVDENSRRLKGNDPTKSQPAPDESAGQIPPLPDAASLLSLLLIGMMAYNTHRANRRSKADLERQIYQQIARSLRKPIEK